MSKGYNTTTATRDALDLALGAANMAHTLAQQAGLPVVRRLELLLVELTEIEKDVQHVERQQREEKPGTLTLEQVILDTVMKWHPYQPKRQDYFDAAERLVASGQIVKRADGKYEPPEASIPIPIANMLVNLHPHERMALDAAVLAPINPKNANDRLACESLFRKGVFRLNPESAFEIEPKYAPWAKRALTPHEILANLPVHLRELLRVIDASGGKVRNVPDGQQERSYGELLAKGILVSDGALDRLRIADPFKGIAA